MTIITHATGYVIVDAGQPDSPIFATGATESEAWANMPACHEREYQEYCDDLGTVRGDWRDEYLAVPATAELIAGVAAFGGGFLYGNVGEIACTIEQEDEYNG